MNAEKETEKKEVKVLKKERQVNPKIREKRKKNISVRTVHQQKLKKDKTVTEDAIREKAGVERKGKGMTQLKTGGGEHPVLR